jgi:group I intron endonuclease
MGTRKPGTMKIKNEVILGRIYRIYNDIDDMIYIGSTIKPLVKRLGDHMYSYNINTNIELYHHIKKIGLHNFTIELLEWKLVNKLTELYKLEQYWMDKENPQNLLNNKKAYMKIDIINDKA